MSEGVPVCWACEQEPKKDMHGRRSFWMHYNTQGNPVLEAQRVWDHAMRNEEDRGIVKEGKQPEANQCFCTRVDCMYKKIEAWKRAEAARGGGAFPTKCAICTKGWRSTPRLRHPGSYLHAMRIYFARQAFGAPGGIPLGNTLCESSVLCMACYDQGARFARNIDHVKLSAREDLELRRLGEPLPENSVEGARAATRRQILARLADGKFLHLQECVELYAAARASGGLAPRGDKYLTEYVRNLFVELGGTLSDVVNTSFNADEVGARDGRTVRHYVMPNRIAFVEVAKIHERLLAAERELVQQREDWERLRKDGNEEGDEQGGPTQEDRQKDDRIRKAGEIVASEIRFHTAWRNRGKAGLGDFDVEIPDPAEYVRKFFPRRLAILLATVCGVGELIPSVDGAESQGDSAAEGTTRPAGEAVGVCEATSDESGEGEKPEQREPDSREAIFVYMLGTMIGKAVLGRSYMAPHDLKLSQAFKMRGMSEKNMSFLSSIRICWGDSMRYARERGFEGVADGSLLKRGLDFACSVAWDNNDTDPHAAITNATHLSQIGACAHQLLQPGKCLGLESLWKKVKDVTLDMLKKGDEAADHDATIAGWNSLLFRILGDSPHYLSAEGGEQSCLEVKIKARHTAAECKVASTNLFLQAGSTKRLADNEAALDRIQRCCHAELEWREVDGKWLSTVRRRVLVEGDEETYRIMVQLKNGNPEKYKWMLPHPGGWHIMLHMTKALMTKYYGAGIELVAKALGGDDKHAAAGSKYRRSHHLLTVTYEAMWWAVIERYTKAMRAKAGASSAVGAGATEGAAPFVGESHFFFSS